MELLVVAPDSFGSSVFRGLSELCPNHRLSFSDHFPADLSHTAHLVFATSNRQPASYELSNAAAAWENEVTFIHASLQRGVIRIGPTVIPNLSACWACFSARERQHHVDLDAETCEVESSPNRGPFILGVVAQMAAARIAWLLESKGNLELNAGLVWKWDLASRSVETSRISGIHACSRCGLGRDKATLSTAELFRECSDLWLGDR